MRGRAASADDFIGVRFQCLRSGPQKAAESSCLHSPAVAAVNGVQDLPVQAQITGCRADAIKTVRRPADRLLRLFDRPAEVHAGEHLAHCGKYTVHVHALSTPLLRWTGWR